MWLPGCRCSALYTIWVCSAPKTMVFLAHLMWNWFTNFVILVWNWAWFCLLVWNWVSLLKDIKVCSSPHLQRDCGLDFNREMGYQIKYSFHRDLNTDFRGQAWKTVQNPPSPLHPGVWLHNDECCYAAFIHFWECTFMSDYKVALGSHYQSICDLKHSMDCRLLTTFDCGWL